jgi:ABC-type transporter Mla MlaB component
MATITTLTDGETTTLTGDLTEESVFELERCAQEPLCCAVQVDLCDIGQICVAGKALLAKIFGEGLGPWVGAQASP